MKHIFRNVTALIALVLCFVMPLTVVAAAPENPDQENDYILAEAVELSFEIEEPADVEINDVYDELYSMYGVECYSAHTQIPQYFQTDYNNVVFSGGTVKSHGCGITSLGMVASYLLDEKLLPDEMARRYNNGPSPASAMERGIRELGLNCEKYYGDAVHDHVWEAIEEGRPVIALMRSESLFTTRGHFLVIAGMTEDGKYIVNDPNKANYVKPRLSDGFRNGFTKEEISQGLSGVYIFDKKVGAGKQETALTAYADVMNAVP